MITVGSHFFQEITVTEKGQEKKILKKVEEDRELMGVARVGELAKGLLLTGTLPTYLTDADPTFH